MKKESTIPKALAFIGLILVGVGVFFGIRHILEKQEEQKRMEEVKEVGALPDLRININGKFYTAKVEVSYATKKFVEELPIEVKMEKRGLLISGYTYFKLPVEPKKIKNVKKGDILIVDDSHIAIAIDSFESSNRYTLVGHIDNLGKVPSSDIIVGINKKD